MGGLLLNKFMDESENGEPHQKRKPLFRTSVMPN